MSRMRSGTAKSPWDMHFLGVWLWWCLLSSSPKRWAGVLLVLSGLPSPLSSVGSPDPMPRSPRELALDIAYTHLGKFYSWGGDDPAGFDCSGLISDVLKAPGILKRGERLTAQMFHDRWPTQRQTSPAALKPGMLVFWARPNGTIRHVEMVYDVLTNGTVTTIGASGGGPNTKTLADAQRDNAFVQIRPLAPNWVAAVDPFAEDP